MAALLFSCALVEGAQEERAIEVDFAKPAGVIRPLNGVNGGPIVTRGAFDLSPQFAELGIQHIRLHDIPWTYEDAVDIDCVFPRFDADPDDPKSYNFATTDYYVKTILPLGAEMTFRLGYSAEWPFHPPIHKAPPKDFKKWAAVCTRIVRHYTQGWADGYKYKIREWEIWNEPDIPSFWSGTPEEFYQLYEMTAKAVKALDPATLKVGGPALAGTHKFLEGLLKHCQETKTPVDFVSWHRYARNPFDLATEAATVQALMDKYGFSKADNILNEWNYFPGDWDRQLKEPEYRRDLFANQMGGAPGAAYDAAALVYLQDSSVDIADFYQGTTMFWGGLFDEFGVPRKPYYTFKAFKILLETPERAATSGSDQSGFAVLAGMSKDQATANILISNFGATSNHYKIALRGLPEGKTYDCEWYAVDGSRDLGLVKSEKLKPGPVTISGDVETPSVCLIRLRAR